LVDVLGFDDQLWNCCHNHIQWVFPTDQASRFNQDAPLLDTDALACFRTEAEIQRNLRQSLNRFLSFMGLSLEAGSSEAGDVVQISRAANFDRRILTCWRGPTNHNWMRVSRVLQCLALVGLEVEKQALLSCLMQVVADHPGMIEEKNCPVVGRACTRCSKPVTHLGLLQFECEGWFPHLCTSVAISFLGRGVGSESSVVMLYWRHLRSSHLANGGFIVFRTARRSMQHEI